MNNGDYLDATQRLFKHINVYIRLYMFIYTYINTNICIYDEVLGYPESLQFIIVLMKSLIKYPLTRYYSLSFGFLF